MTNTLAAGNANGLETSHLIQYPPLLRYRSRYQDLRLQPVKITAVLRPGSALIHYDPLHLDNLLARCVVDEATLGEGLPPSTAPYELPVPLQRLYASQEGLPLWASTCFHPDGEVADDTVYWHKRAPSGRGVASKTGRYSVKTSSGRWMERRVPMPAKVCSSWSARAIGDPEEILRLLTDKPHIGKRRSCGFGEVTEWRVSPLTTADGLDYDHLAASILTRQADLDDPDSRVLLRPIPLGAVQLLRPYQPARPPSRIGWTPPQWKPSLFAQGWPTGTPLLSPTPALFPAAEDDPLVDVDYFQDAVG